MRRAACSDLLGEEMVQPSSRKRWDVLDFLDFFSGEGKGGGKI